MQRPRLGKLGRDDYENNLIFAAEIDAEISSRTGLMGESFEPQARADS
jgi:hypothetical protein